MDYLSPAQEYLRSGLSVIPLRPDTKVALRKWSDYQDRPPTVVEVEKWWTRNPRANLAIVGGQASGNLIIFDADEPALVDYLLSVGLDLLSDFWVVETGSHKLHIYCRTRGDLETEVFNHGPIHLGEMRGHGSYVVAPPSRVNEEDHDQAYKTLWGSPDTIPTVKDAKRLFHRLVRAYLKEGGKTLRSRPKEYIDENRILPPLSPADEKAMRKRITGCPDLDSGTKRLILTADPSASFTSNSHASWGATKGMLVAGFTEEDIELIFATFSIGLGCYRNKTRKGSYGYKFMQATLIAAHKKIGDETTAAESASGENFTIVRVTKKMYDDPTYNLVVNGALGGDVEVECLIDDILSEARLRKKLAQGLNFVPEFTAKGKLFTKFSDAILRMATVEMIPQEAKTSGVIRNWIIERLTSPSQMMATVPTDEHQVALGWHDPKNGHSYARGGRLLSLASIAMNPRPTPTALWQVVESMGGKEVVQDFPDTGHQERIWSFPKAAIKQ